ncbi:MAG: NTP transferase domain-containing protein [Bacteroidales bacterium]|jgi:NDP-sugar pyrophosphorylase family protein|nr:NTP transferase domain-containing protein [Bacteroidales bacterium]MCI1785182.1 NTP transferase domain-containing protein [Bacteroidales bacterium]
MKAMVFAAGMGTRLKPLTDNLPKALIPISGQPLLYHVIMKLKAAGICDIVINVHHFADKILAYLRENDNFGLNISISDETDMLRETGGGIRFASRLLCDPEGTGSNDRFLIHNVDIISNLDIKGFVSCAHPDSLADVLVSDRVTQRYFLFDKVMRLVGWTNLATGQVKTPFRDLDVDSCTKLAFAGIHIVSEKIFEVFDEVDSAPGEFPLYEKDGCVIGKSDVKCGEKFSITDFYLRVAAKYPVYGISPAGLRIIDVGKIDTIKKAEASGLF